MNGTCEAPQLANTAPSPPFAASPSGVDTTDGRPPRLSNMCALCLVTAKRPIGTTGVHYCPHCDAVCPRPTGQCVACNNMDIDPKLVSP